MEMASSRHSRFVAMLFLSPLLTSVTGKGLRLFLNLCLLISTWQLAAQPNVMIIFVIPDAQRLFFLFLVAGCSC